MATDPQPPPEATLIRDRMNAMVPKPSRSELARRAGISPSLWAKIENGYDQPAPGTRVPYRGSDRAVAAMAAVTGVLPAELEQAGRPEAAGLLAAMPEPDRTVGPAAADGLREMLSEINSKLDRLLGPDGPKARRARKDSGDETNGTRRAG